MKNLWQDLRYGLRMLVKSPGFTGVAVLSLALGIGANTSIFSLVNAVLLRPLPVEEPGRLVFLFNGTRNSPYSVVSYPNYVDYRDQIRAFSSLATYSGIALSLNVEDRAELVSGLIVSGNYFDLLGVRAALGRTFLPDEDRTPGTHPVAVISYGLWQRRFGGDPNMIGKQLALNGRSFTVIGVAPGGFNGIEPGGTSDIYVPMMMQALVRPPRAGYSGEMNPDLLSRRMAGWLSVVGRLKPGVTIEQAQAEAMTIARQLEQAYPDMNRDRIATLYPVSKGDPNARGTVLSISALFLSVVGLVLLIACANVANLLLSRASARRKEISIRLSLGASRSRLVRQLLTESVLLAFCGGAAGLLLGLWGVDLFRRFPPPANFFSFAFDFSLDGRVLGFTLLLSILTGLIFGIAPALQASKTDLVPALKDESPALDQGSRRFTLRNLLVIAQVALSLVLLVSAGLFLRSLQQARSIDPGFNPEHVLVSPLNINLLRYTRQQGQQFYRQVIERVEALPGVRSASLARVLLLSGSARTSSVMVEGRSSPDRESRSEGTGGGEVAQDTTLANIVGLKYFQTLGIGLLRGRDFTAQDGDGAPGVAIIGETFVRRYFPGEDPLGRRISLHGTSGPWLEVIGVARDTKYRTLGEAPAPVTYLPLLQNHETGMTLHVRTAGDPVALVAAVRRELSALEKNLPASDIRTMTELIGRSLFPARMGAALLGALGLLALLLASVGLYGVMSYSVSRRAREIGIRIALGAVRGDVLRLVLKEAMTLVAIGLGVGLGAAFVVTRLLAGFLYGVSVTDPATFAGIALLLTLVALLAGFMPARRATKVDPIVALRYE